MKVLFFASVREQLGCAELQVPAGSDPMTTDDLRGVLADRGGETWRQALMQPNLICAVNHTVVHEPQLLDDGDEVAFFPPVTGG